MLASLNKSAVAAKSRARRGLTLIEAAMVLTILALVIGGVMLFYSSANTGRKISQATSQVGAVASAVRAAYSGQPSYAGLNQSQLLSQLPNSMQSGGNLVNAFSGPINVQNESSGFSVEFDGLPAEACSKMAAADMGRNVYSVEVNGSAVSLPITPTVAQGNCGNTNGAPSSTLKWYFQ